jgi:ketosteroid isomerase-like protein
MSAESNIEVVTGIYEAFGRGDLEFILDRVTDDVDWGEEAAGDAAPWWGRRTGKDGVSEFFAELGEATEVTEFSPESFTANDNDEVMARVRYGYRARSSGKEASSTYIQHYFRLRDGKVAYWGGSSDTQLAAETLAA